MIASLTDRTGTRGAGAGTSSGGKRSRTAFTLTELLVVIALLTVLTTMALAASRGSNEHVLRTHCASNLRQIGVGLNQYAAERDDFLPVCGLPQGQNPWQTYEVGRVQPGTDIMLRGFVSLGLLVRTGAIQDAKPLYCSAQIFPQFTYAHYSTEPYGWPSTPEGSGDDNIRAGYSYYPQLRVTETVGRGTLLPALNYTRQQLEFGGSLPLVTPAKLTEVNPRKSIATDIASITTYWSHQALGSVAGLNALFPDGAVIFQNARTDPQKFNPALWNNIGSSLFEFRFVMNSWEQ